MAELRELRAVIDAAERAAEAGDIASAERLLREAAQIQEASLGPLHPDLAHTLNNLGVVCERTGKLDGAEACYRRAHAIARASLPPDHPFVATSGQNLREFRAARGIPVERPQSVRKPERPTPVIAAPAWPSSRESVPVAPSHPPIVAPSGPARSWRPLVIGVVCASVLVLIAVLVSRAWFESEAGAGFSPETAAPRTESPAPSAPAPATATPAAPAATDPAPASAPPPPPRTTAPEPPPAAPAAAPRTAAPSLATPTVALSQVCRKLSTGGARGWTCDAVSSPVAPGTLFFYTRLKSPRDTTVEHRWYQGDRLHQAVELPVRANAGVGYRTFSRNTVIRANAGDWRVELRAKDGTLLDEQRFTVR